ncbi:MAG: endo alpha-1,4 polygalactosaminidase [Anaerolineales bacterium]|nr:endo alpha-1,4 polygalactosaminidase [Anaerolineales bacterium]
MKKSILVLIAALLISCSNPPEKTKQSPSSKITPVEIPITPYQINENPASLPLEMSWQIQYSGDMDFSLGVEMYNIDLFDISKEEIAQLTEQGIFVMCYFSAGSHEDWRPDADDFPISTLGKSMAGWEGETWLDIRQIAVLQPIMEKRLDMAVAKGCNGVDPDNVNGYENETGFPLTFEDQIAFNIFLSNAAHARGLMIGLKNDLGQIKELVSYFDWILNEECYSFHECDLLLPFIEAGKPVFVIEYDSSPQDFCEQANQMNFNVLHKNLDLDAYRVSCR